MNNGWTSERKAKQALAIQQWKPWEVSTGPKSAEGKARASRNAFKGGKRPALRQAIAMVRRYVKDNQEFLEELN